MLDLPDHPVLDKRTLVGGCVRLPLKLDAERLRQEVERLPESSWQASGGRVGVQKTAVALFLRGYAPAEGNKPIEDRPALQSAPYIREIIEQLIPAPPMRCLLANLPPGAAITPHIDDGVPYFWKTLRVHMPVSTHDRAWMMCDGQGYVMKEGEVWMLNNNAIHAVWNADATLPRTHLICDFLRAGSARAACSWRTQPRSPRSRRGAAPR